MGAMLAELGLHRGGRPHDHLPGIAIFLTAVFNLFGDGLRAASTC
jgi:ABC-type dipeptide/oligopeptide/nickel transport system permease subunit